jgi:transcriptional regulator with XRE-family HTH domain
MGVVYMFAEKMKQLRRSRGMTQAELAEKLGLSASAIGMYEQGRREPELSVIMELCNIFNVPADVLLGTPSAQECLEIKDVMQDIQDRLLAADELTLDGTPMSRQDIDQLIEAIQMGTNLVLNRVEKQFPQQ